MDHSLPRFARITFLVHLIVAILFGLWLLIAPESVSAVFVLEANAQTLAVLRASGGMMLGLGAVTSSCCLFAKSWRQVTYIIYAEVVYLLLQCGVGMASLVMGQGTVLFNLTLIVLSAGLLTLFVMAWLKRPR